MQRRADNRCTACAVLAGAAAPHAPRSPLRHRRRCQCRACCARRDSERAAAAERLAARTAAIVPLAELERRAILRAFGLCGGHWKRTARALGIGCATLGRKLAQYRASGALALPVDSAACERCSKTCPTATPGSA